MVRDFWESTRSVPSGILISKWLAISRSQLVAFLVASSIPNLVLRVILLFQTTISPWHGANGELSNFVYCLLQKNKASGSLPVVERWESYMLPNHSSFVAIEKDHFLVGTRVHAALEEMTSHYLKKEFRSSARRFFESFTTTILSTVGARSKLGQGFSCFCPKINIGGDDNSAFFLLGQLSDGLIVCGWEKTSNMEARKAEFQSLANDQRQLDCHAGRKHSDISDVLSYLTHQSRFRSHRHLYRLSLLDFLCCDQKINTVMSFRSSK